MGRLSRGCESSKHLANSSTGNVRDVFVRPVAKHLSQKKDVLEYFSRHRLVTNSSHKFLPLNATFKALMQDDQEIRISRAQKSPKKSAPPRYAVSAFALLKASLPSVA